MDFDHTSGRCWGQEPIDKLGISTLGVVCKGNLWYPSEGMKDACAAAAVVANRFTTCVLYGFSMGAYGALKYSRAIGATQVIALSPQWSIDPADVYSHDQRLLSYCQPNLNEGMSIKGATLKVAFIYLATTTTSVTALIQSG